MNSPQPRPVSDLIRHARSGDAQSRQELFEASRGYMGLVARAEVESWLRVKVDASDVVQQTLLEAHRDFARFQGESEKEWLGWLRRILAHNVADYVRQYRGTAKRRVGREIPLRQADDSAAAGAPEPAAPVATPSQEFLQLDAELRVSAALEQLPPDYREVILLRNLQRLPFNEVAERMGRSRPAVQMLWMRAIQRMQELLAE
jgi:RNA polymerase sigma-70 factor (ECF subfamily)